MTRKEIIYDALNILSRFNYTDDNRNDPDWMGYKIDQVCGEFKKTEFSQTGVVNPAWISTLGLIPFTETDFSDSNLGICNCPISKAILPAVLNLPNPNYPDQNYGIKNIISACGKTSYYPYQIENWKMIPSEHVRSKFHYYAQIGTNVFVNKLEKFLLVHAVLASPLDGFIMNTTNILSGNLVAGQVYTVITGQIVHNAIAYQAGQSFTAANTTFTGSGTVLPQVFKRQVTDDDPYPCTQEMARNVVLNILQQEFGIEKQRITDVKNDGQDDQQEIEKT